MTKQQKQLPHSNQQPVQKKHKLIKKKKINSNNKPPSPIQQPMISQLQKQGKNIQDLSIVKMKIQQNLTILANVKQLSQGRSRSQILDQQMKLLCHYYNYNQQLMQHFMSFFNPNQLVQFLQANQSQRPLSIRTNTLKTRRKQLAQSLIQRGVSLDPLAQWSKVGIKIYDSKVPIGATPQYLAGYYILQSASSLLPVIALAPQINERILDMAAAPGGKTSYICQLMKNTGIVIANDSSKQRIRALQFNLMRLGISNVAVSNYDGRQIIKHFNNFDRVLLDAPCTGLGIISKDHSIKTNKMMKDIKFHCHLQKQLILAAIDCTKHEGVIVYSTCSVSPLENEQVINYALNKREVKLVESGIEVGQEGFTKYGEKRWNPNMKKTRRIYPHIHNMDGFFVAKLRKL